jgi:hypothetical protein
MPLLADKARAAFTAHYGAVPAAEILDLFADRAQLERLPVHRLLDLLAKA